MNPSTLRDVTGPDPVTPSTSDPSDLVFGIGLWLVIMVAAPLVVLVLAVLLLSVEIPVAVALGLILAIVRFAGIVPWTVAIIDAAGTETYETYRNLVHAVRRIRAINKDRHVSVRWAWM